MVSGEPVLSENAAVNTINIEDNQGQIAIGNYIVQIGSVHGGVVNIAMPTEQPQLRPRPRPVLLRPRRFAGLLDRKPAVEASFVALPAFEPTEFYGAPGSGKTSLLRHLLYQLPSQSFPDGLIYLPARDQPAADLIQALLDAFYESDSPLKLTEVQARHALQTQQALIVLDDVQLSRADVDSVLDAAPNCAFLLASTERHLWSEGRVMALPGLPPEDALTLMERELGQPLIEAEREEALTLCCLLNGHPLHLLQLVALAQKEGLSLAEMTHLLPSEEPDPALTAQLIAALSNPEKRVLATLAPFTNGSPLPAEHLAALTGLSDPEPVVEALLQQKLIQAHSPRYSLTGTLAQALGQSLNLNPIRTRALSYFATWAEQQQPTSAQLREAVDPILPLLTWGEHSGNPADVTRLGRAIEGTLALQKRWGVWGQVLHTTLQAAEASGDQAAVGWSLHQLGTRALCLGDFNVANTHLSQALQIREQLGDQAGAAITHHNLNLLPPPPVSNGSQPPPDASSVAGWGPTALLSGAIIILAGLLLGLGLLWLREPGNEPPSTTNLGITFVTITPDSVAFLPAAPIATATATALPPAPSATATLLPPSPTATFPLPSPTATFTPLPTASPTATRLPPSPSSTPLPPSPTLSPTPTSTRTPTPTGTPTPTWTPTPTPQPVLSVAPDQLLFEAITVGQTTATQSLIFRNVGNGSLLITEITLAGANPADFNLIRQECQVLRLAKNESCTVELTFSPTAVGIQTANLIVQADTGATPLNIPLQGEGLPLGQPDLVITDLRAATDSIRFSQTEMFLPLTVVIQNQGQAEAGIFTSLMCEGQDATCGNALFRFFLETNDPLLPGQAVTFNDVGQLPITMAGQSIVINATADSCVGFEGDPQVCRVTESNENNNGAELEVQLPATNTPPVVTITEPDSDLTLNTTGFDQTQQLALVRVPLQGQASDAEDGPLPETALLWGTDQSELQPAELGSGSAITVPLYTPSCNTTVHTITLTATDSDGSQSTANRNITIVNICVD